MCLTFVFRQPERNAAIDVMLNSKHLNTISGGNQYFLAGREKRRGGRSEKRGDGENEGVREEEVEKREDERG